MEKCVGMFPSTMLSKAPRTRDFFDESTGVCRGATDCDAENRRHIRRMKRLEVRCVAWLWFGLVGWVADKGCRRYGCGVRLSWVLWLERE